MAPNSYIVPRVVSTALLFAAISVAPNLSVLDTAQCCQNCARSNRAGNGTICQCSAGRSRHRIISVNCKSEFEIEAITGKIRRYYDSGHVSWYKVRWKGWHGGYDKWCTVEDLTSCQEMVNSYNDAHTGLGRVA